MKLFEPETKFAFFAANYGWTREQYESITPIERLFLIKEYENKVVRLSTLLQGAVELAVANVFRKKGKSRKKLWKKKYKEGEIPISRKEFKDLRSAFKNKFGK